MLRTQILLTEEERRLLDRARESTGRSVSSLVREAVRRTYREHESSRDVDLAADDAGLGSWAAEGTDGAAWVEAFRAGRRLDDHR